MSTPRAPSSDHSAISTAPVSDAGTMPSRQSAGMPSTARDRVMTSASRAFGSLRAMAAAEWRAFERGQREAGSLGTGAG